MHLKTYTRRVANKLGGGTRGRRLAVAHKELIGIAFETDTEPSLVADQIMEAERQRLGDWIERNYGKANEG